MSTSNYRRRYRPSRLLVAGSLLLLTAGEACQPRQPVSQLTFSPMFTLERIHQAHARVKTGADFPQYVQDLKQLGLRAYDHYVTDGQNEYRATTGATLASPPVGTALTVDAQGQPAQVEYAIHIHQQGQTDYPTFCRQVASAGVEKWTVDTEAMTCTYYDQQGRALVTEPIPVP
jgi:uncharacterized protein YbcV (DUF1398 family)